MIILGGGFRLAMVGWAGLLVVGLVLASPTLVVAPGLGAVCTWHGGRVAADRREANRRRVELIEVVDLLIQRLKAGASLASAVADCGFDDFAAEEAAHAGSDTTLEPDRRLVASTLAVLKLRGGPALPSLERLSDTLRSSAAVAFETRALAGQATASAMALAALPGVFVVILALVQQPLRQFYLYEVVGMICLLAAALLSYLGWVVMRHLIEEVR